MSDVIKQGVVQDSPLVTGRSYGGLTAEQRQGERRRRFLDAAASVARERGLNDTSYRAVCRASGLTERYFYESFTNLDELLLAVFEEELQAALAEVLAAVGTAESDPRKAMDLGVGAFVHRFANERLLSRLVVESPAHPALRTYRDTAIETFVGFMLQMAYEVVGGPKDAREERMARHTSVMLVGGFNELLSQWVQRGKEEPHDEIVEDVVELFFAAMTHYSKRKNG
jgi:AcrR family transcriptional regulator